MRLYLLALNPTDSVTEGFLPAAFRLGLRVTVLTDAPQDHRRVYSGAPGHRPGWPASCFPPVDSPGFEILPCEVRDFRAVITAVATHGTPDVIFTNSDHLQTQAALAAAYVGLPAKNWRTTLRTKDKAQMRRSLAAAGVDSVWSAELAADAGPEVLDALDVPYPCVLKPREGVASEDVVFIEGPRDLLSRYQAVRARRPHTPLVIEEYLPGELYTLETLGDGRLRHALGGFHTRLSAPPGFIEQRMDFVAAHPDPVMTQLRAQLDALGVGLGACHTEFVVLAGRARLIEVNYRAIGDQCDLLLADLLGIPLFEHILRAHLGEDLPRDLGDPGTRQARVDYPCADRSGTLTAAPAACDLDLAGARLVYRPLRPVGEQHPLYHTNRDYLGVLRVIGADQHAVDLATQGFLADRRWEITP